MDRPGHYPIPFDEPEDDDWPPVEDPDVDDDLDQTESFQFPPWQPYYPGRRPDAGTFSDQAKAAVETAMARLYGGLAERRSNARGGR